MSDIFEAYAKIAEEHGLIDNSITKKAERNDRSQALDSAALLYGVTPPGEDAKHIMEKAHPETAVIMRAYDGMNAVLENNIERQNMMAYIALKQPDGHLIQRRYVKANNDLMNAVIKSAFIADNSDEEDLMKLADSCAERLSKTAFEPMTTAIIVGSVAALGLIYYFGYAKGEEIVNVVENGSDALEKLNEDDMIGTNLSTKPYYSVLNTLLENLIAQAREFSNNRNKIVADSMEELVGRSGNADMQAILAQSEEYKKTLLHARKVMPEIAKNIQMAHADETTDAIWKSVWWSDWEQLLSYLGFWKDKGGGLYAAINQELAILGAADNAAKKQKGLVESTIEKMQAVNPFADKKPEPNKAPTFSPVSGLAPSTPANESEPMPVAASHNGLKKEASSKSGIVTLDDLYMEYGELFKDDGRR